MTTPTHTLVVTVDEDNTEQMRGEVICHGVTAECRIWWECFECNALDDDAREEIAENGEAHGVEHQYGEFGLCYSSEQCLAQSLDAACEAISDAARGLAPGSYPCEVDYVGDGYINVIVLAEAGDPA